MFSVNKTIAFTIILFFVFSACLSQTIVPGSEENFIEIYNLAKEKYDVDQQLLNGIYYENPYYKALAHPFLDDGNFQVGSVIFRNKKYDEVRMKYDIYDQQIIINPKPDNSMLMILLANEFVSEFWVDGLHFKKFSFEESESSFYQVVSDKDDIKCYHAWYKLRYKSYHNANNVSFIFSDSKQKSFLLINGKLFRYRNNRSFVSLFPDKAKSQIRRFLKSERIKINKADDGAMKEVIHFCQSTFNQNKM